MSQAKSRLPFLDGIRGIAILSVFLYHSVETALRYDNVIVWHGAFRAIHFAPSTLIFFLPTYGSLGVPVFFAVSGFCIHLSHSQSKETGWKNFIVRRFFRIYPCYLLSICLFGLMGLVGSLKTSQGAFQLATHLLAIHNFFPQTLYGINGSFWSIAVELQLYALYPLLLFMISKLGWRKALLIAGCLELTIRAAWSMGFQVPFPVLRSPFAFWLSWCLGALIAERFMNGQHDLYSKVRFDLVVFITFILSLYKPFSFFEFPAFAFLTCIALDRFISEKWRIPGCRIGRAIWNHLSFLGKVSFGFYLFHQPLIQMAVDPFARPPWLKVLVEKCLPFGHVDLSGRPLAMFFLCLLWYPLILALSYLAYKSVEQPAISLGKRLLSNRAIRQCSKLELV